MPVKADVLHRVGHDIRKGGERGQNALTGDQGLAGRLADVVAQVLREELRAFVIVGHGVAGANDGLVCADQLAEDPGIGAGIPGEAQVRSEVLVVRRVRDGVQWWPPDSCCRSGCRA